jgi:hypothetical protein
MDGNTCCDWAFRQLPHPKKLTPPRTKHNCIDKWESNEQGTAETGEGTVLMSYLTAQYTKITYFTNENENVSSRGIGCRIGNKWKICCL